MEAFEKAGKNIDYYALDLSRPELERTLSFLGNDFKHVHYHGLFGTYDDGLAWLKQQENIGKPKCILSMGSSIGNFNRSEVADFLKGFADILGPTDTMLVGLDACQDKNKIYHAYNDKEGKTHEFIINGLMHANKLMGKETFKKEDWEVIGEFDEHTSRHQAFYSPAREVLVEGTRIKARERIRVEESNKYSLPQSNEVWQLAGLMPKAIFGNNSNEYRKSAFKIAPLFSQRPSLPSLSIS